MEEGRKKYPPVPSTFVTLVQLQERWLKEQQRKEREKGEEEERKRRVEEERKRDDQRKNQMRQNESGQRSKTNTLSHHRSFQKNRQNHWKKSSITNGMIDRESEKSQVGAIVVDDGERKIDDLKKNKNKKRRWGNKKKAKPSAEEDLTGGTEQSSPEYEAEENIPMVLAETDGEKEGAKSGLQRNGKNLVVNDMVWEKKVPVARPAEIGRKFQDLSLSGGEVGKERHPRNVHGGQWKYNRGSSGMLNSRRQQKPRDSNVVCARPGAIERKFQDLSLRGGKLDNERHPRNVHGGQWKYNRGSSGMLNGRRPQKPQDSNLAWVRKGDTSGVVLPELGAKWANEGWRRPEETSTD